MSASLYNDRILSLASAVRDTRLASPMGSSEKRSPICGSRITVDVNLDADGRVNEVGMLVRACALGQASATLLAAAIVGQSERDLLAASDALAAWLAGEGETPQWPGLDVFEPALSHTARHPSIRLAFEAAAEAAGRAKVSA